MAASKWSHEGSNRVRVRNAVVTIVVTCFAAVSQVHSGDAPHRVTLIFSTNGFQLTAEADWNVEKAIEICGKKGTYAIAASADPDEVPEEYSEDAFSAQRYVQQLSKMRANNVKMRLVSLGVPPDNVSTSTVDADISLPSVERRVAIVECATTKGAQN